jgi:putative cardiolipin synthase
MRAMIKWFRYGCFACAAVCLSACATVDFDYPKDESYALDDASDTSLGKQIPPVVAQHPAGESGFYTLNDGIDALALRLLMAERAEKTLDAQYYLLTADVVGYAFIGALLRAADRGVRVRLLLDDILTAGYDAGMAALDFHPNFEVRIFNPFGARTFRYAGSITSVSRINRRMHNKSITVDNQATIIGGRNIASEYFGAREDKKFGDLDVFAIGPVVQEVSDMFDSYWNHRAAAPVPAFAKMPDDPAAALEQLRARIEQNRQEIRGTPYAEAVLARVDYFIDAPEDVMVWAPYQLVYDSPDKSDKQRAAEAASIRTPLRESILNAEKEFFLISPYFVPLKSGVEAFAELEKRGVDVTVITNSLAANNQKTVHGGYAPSRKPLLEAGVEIYEVRADAEVAGSEIMAFSGARATLHTKAFVVDRDEFFIGSFNFDPRSANINTELGVIIISPELAGAAVDKVREKLPTETFEVFLNEKGQLRWRGIDEDGEVVVFDKEPQTGWWDRFVAGFYRMLPIRNQL